MAVTIERNHDAPNAGPGVHVAMERGEGRHAGHGLEIQESEGGDEKRTAAIRNRLATPAVDLPAGLGAGARAVGARQHPDPCRTRQNPGDCHFTGAEAAAACEASHLRVP